MENIMTTLTPEEHVKRVRQVAFQLHRADYGMGMPRDYELVLLLRTLLKQVEGDAMTALYDAFVNGPMTFVDAVQALEDIGEEEAERVVSEWAELAEADHDTIEHDPENIYGLASIRQSIEEDRK